MRRTLPILWIFLALVGGAEIGALIERHGVRTVQPAGMYAGPKSAFQAKPEGQPQKPTGFLQQV